MKLNNLTLKLSAAVSTYLMASSAAHAQASIINVSGQVSSNIYAVTDVVSTGSYLTGAGFAMAGVMSLKKHAENPGQEPVSKGVGRIAAGAALGALPWVVNTAFNSMGVTEDQGVGVSGNTDRF